MHNTYSYIKYKKENEYLAHHGILGQKWGKKNGPPYPLDPEDHSAAEKKENHGHYSQGVTQDRGGSSSGSGSSSGAQNEPQNGKKQIDKKKILKAAAITAGVMTVVGGTSIGVALAVKEPEVFGNALDSVKNVTIDNFSKEGREMREYAKEMAKDYGGEDSKVLKKEIVSSYKEGLNDQRRAERNEKRFNRQTKDIYNETDEMKDDLAEQMARGREKASDNRKQSMLDEARAEEQASRKAQEAEERALAKNAKEPKAKRGSEEEAKQIEDYADRLTYGMKPKEAEEIKKSIISEYQNDLAKEKADKQTAKENKKFEKTAKQEINKWERKQEQDEAIANIKEKATSIKEKVTEPIERRQKEKAEKQAKINTALARFRTGNYPDTEEGRDLRQKDFGFLWDNASKELSKITKEARSHMGPTEKEQTNTYAQISKIKEMQDKQVRAAKANRKANPQSSIGKGIKTAKVAAGKINEGAGTVFYAKNTADNVKRALGILGLSAGAASLMYKAGKRVDEKQAQQQGGYQQSINPQYQQQTQQFKKKKR